MIALFSDGAVVEVYQVITLLRQIIQ